MELVPGGEGDDGVPKGLSPSSLGTDEEHQESACGVRGFLIANGADGERMRSELVDRGDREEEVLSRGPGSTFRSKNGESDSLAGHQLRERISLRRDERGGGRHQGFYPGRHTGMLSQQWGIVIGFVIFRDGVHCVHLETDAGKR